MKNLYPYMRPFRGVIVLGIVLKAVSTLIDLLIPYLMSYVIDVGIVNRDVKLIVMLCVGMLVSTGIGYGTTVWAHQCAVKGGQGIGEKLRDALFAHIQKLPIDEVEKLSTASLITRVTNDVEHVQRTVMMTCRMMVRAPLIMIGGTVMSLILDPYLTCIMFGGMLVLFVISMVSYKLTRPIYRNVKQKVDVMAGILRENLSGIRVIKAFAKIEEEVTRLDIQSKKVKKLELKAGKINAYTGPSVRLVVNLTIIGILCIGSMRVNTGELQIGKVVTILNYINMVLGVMMAIPRMFMMFSQASTSASRIEEVLELQKATEYGEAVTPRKEGYILQFEKVSFRYPHTKKYALRDVSFQVKQGETMAIIGTTGAGKTSILNLILRLYEPTEGKIVFQGRNIKSYDKQYLTEKITAAMQQYNLFSMSIRDNIILDKELDEERLEASAKAAQIGDLLEGLEEQFDYKISQNGNNLSGGQKQRISIARTLYRGSDLVVLDDVSAALDYKTDLKLRRALRKNYKGQTVILISQRISSVKNADSILVLEKGRSVGFGTHEELLKYCDTYQALCASQEEKEVMAYETLA